jgi:amidase
MEHARQGETNADSAGAVHIPARFSSPSFSPNRCAAARVAPGAEVVFHTADDGYERLSLLPAHRARQAMAMEELNTVTGPLHVEGALPGDALRVEVLDVTVRRCWSVWTADDVISGCLASKLEALGHPIRVRELAVDHDSNTVQISERLRVPLEPMIGCIATAPEPHDECQWNCGCSTMEPTYKHGGNMDLRELGAGTAIVLPVQNEGGLLFVGDLHACMVIKELRTVELASEKETIHDFQHVHLRTGARRSDMGRV